MLAFKRLIPTNSKSLLKYRCFSVASDLKLTSESVEMIDGEIYNIIEAETVRERETVSLSPSSNYASKPVLDTLQTVLQNKYSEGYPHARYYGGNENVDNAEELTQTRALQLFNLNPDEWRVNVQPLGSYNALQQVLTALIPLHSRVMAPVFNQLSSPQSAINRFFNILSYDEDSLDSLASNYKPNIIISGNGVDAPFNNANQSWDYPLISTVSQSVSCYHLVDISDVAGLIVANLADSPFKSADVVVCAPFATLRGPRGSAMIFYRSSFASKIDSAVFPGHQGGPHNHAISAMATALKMAQSDEFIGYQNRVVQNAKAMEDALNKKCEKNVQIMANNGHCVGIRGWSDPDVVYQVANKVNMEVLYDATGNELRLSSNAMTTRGLNTDDFGIIVDLMDEVKGLSQTVKQNGIESCEAQINQLKAEVTDFAKQFPLIGID